jgi:hypothetical protein
MNDMKPNQKQEGNMITVDSRKKDPKTEMVVKYESPNGNPTQYKPIRKISPDVNRLSPLARFIVENEDGTYIGGFNHRKNDVRVEGPSGSHPNAGDETWGIPSDARNVCRGYLFPVFEPRDDETEYFNTVAAKIAALAGNGGRVIVNGQVFEVTQ